MGRRHAMAKAAENHVSKVNALFDFFDADKDGQLSSAEYRAYLVGIGLWGQGCYKDECWKDRWPEELNMLLHSEESQTKVERSNFLLMYIDHRSAKLSEDFQKCL